MKDFLDNISQYPKFLAIITLGILSSLFSPLYPFFRNPVTAIASVVALVAAFVTLSLTLRAMLGYDPV
jgi:Protein of unknown function (DUF751)